MALAVKILGSAVLWLTVIESKLCLSFRCVVLPSAEETLGIFTFVTGFVKKVQLLHAAVNKSCFLKTYLNRPWKLLLLASSYSDLDWAGVSEMDSPWSGQSSLSVVAKTTVAESTCSTLRARGDLPTAEGSLLQCIPLPAQTRLSLLKVWVDLHYDDSMGTGDVERCLFFCQLCLWDRLCKGLIDPRSLASHHLSVAKIGTFKPV